MRRFRDMGISIVNIDDLHSQKRAVEPNVDYSIWAPKANPNQAGAISTSDYR